MLELSKQILKKVSFDELLFRKELVKAIRWLKAEELLTFRKWCLESFDKQYRKIIRETFKTTASL